MLFDYWCHAALAIYDVVWSSRRILRICQFFAAYDETAFEDRELCLAAEEGYDAMIRAGHGSDPVIASGADEERCLQNYYQYLRMLQLRYPVNSVRPVPELAVA
jgi:hypothetical protein